MTSEVVCAFFLLAMDVDVESSRAARLLTHLHEILVVFVTLELN